MEVSEEPAACIVIHKFPFTQTSVYVYQTTRGHVPVHRCLCSQRHENLEFHIFMIESQLVGIYKGKIVDTLYSVSTKSLRGFEKLWRANKLS
jgi:hypothetical protein